MIHFTSQKQALKKLAAFATTHQNESPALVEIANCLWCLSDGGVRSLNKRNTSFGTFRFSGRSYSDFVNYINGL